MRDMVGDIILRKGIMCNKIKDIFEWYIWGLESVISGLKLCFWGENKLIFNIYCLIIKDKFFNVFFLKIYLDVKDYFLWFVVLFF